MYGIVKYVSKAPQGSGYVCAFEIHGWNAAQTLDTQILECGDEYDQMYEGDGGMALLRFTITSCARLTHLVISQTAYRISISNMVRTCAFSITCSVPRE